MHKKLVSDLMNLAHGILQLKNKEDVLLLKQKAHAIYEQLAVLAYVEKYLKETPNATQTKEELLSRIASFNKKSVQQETENEQEITTILNPMETVTAIKNDVKDVGDQKTPSLEDELKDTVSVDVTANMFAQPSIKTPSSCPKSTIIQIGLNDRIAFVKHLFGGNQQDFNRIISQLNTFTTEKEAKQFIAKVVKPDYNWKEKTEYETRLMSIITHRFV